jgi:hypothetical protein
VRPREEDDHYDYRASEEPSRKKQRIHRDSLTDMAFFNDSGQETIELADATYVPKTLDQWPFIKPCDKRTVIALLSVLDQAAHQDIVSIDAPITHVRARSNFKVTMTGDKLQQEHYYHMSVYFPSVLRVTFQRMSQLAIAGEGYLTDLSVVGAMDNGGAVVQGHLHTLSQPKPEAHVKTAGFLLALPSSDQYSSVRALPIETGGSSSAAPPSSAAVTAPPPSSTSSSSSSLLSSLRKMGPFW